MQKWADDYDDDVEPFVNYFRSTWIDSAHYRWFEGKDLEILFIKLFFS